MRPSGFESSTARRPRSCPAPGRFCTMKRVLSGNCRSGRLSDEPAEGVVAAARAGAGDDADGLAAEVLFRVKAGGRGYQRRGLAEAPELRLGLPPSPSLREAGVGSSVIVPAGVGVGSAIMASAGVGVGVAAGRGVAVGSSSPPHAARRARITAIAPRVRNRWMRISFLRSCTVPGAHIISRACTRHPNARQANARAVLSAVAKGPRGGESPSRDCAGADGVSAPARCVPS